LQVMGCTFVCAYVCEYTPFSWGSQLSDSIPTGKHFQWS